MKRAFSIVGLLLMLGRAPGATLEAPTGLEPGSRDASYPTIDGSVVLLRWEAVSGAAGYRVGVRDLDNNDLQNYFVPAPSNSLPVALVAGHPYRWNIIAVSGAQEGPVSESRYFKIGIVRVNPRISNVAPSPVPASDGAQALIINGDDFRMGCSVNLVDKTSNERFVNVKIVFRRIGQIVVTPNFTRAEHSWTVEVVNPGGFSSGEFPFSILSTKRIARLDWWDGPQPWAHVTLIVCCVSAIGWWWYVYRRAPKKLLEISRDIRREERDRLLRDLHDRASSDIAYLARLADQTLHGSSLPPETEAQVRELQSAAKDAETAIGDLIWAGNPQNESLRELASKIRERIRERLQAQTFDADFEGWPAPVPDVPIGAEVSSQLLYVCHEVLNNVIKHAGATKLFCALGTNENSVSLSFRDNGRGFKLGEQVSAGRGLSNMRTRIEKVCGFLEVRTGVGTGTEIVIRAPLKTERALPLRGG